MACARNKIPLTSPLHSAQCLWTTSGADSAISGTTMLSRSTSMAGDAGGGAATSIMGPRAPPQAEAVPPQKPHVAMRSREGSDYEEERHTYTHRTPFSLSLSLSLFSRSERDVGLLSPFRGAPSSSLIKTFVASASEETKT